MTAMSKRSMKRKRKSQKKAEEKKKEARRQKARNDEKEAQDEAKRNYENFYGIPEGCSTLEQVQKSSAGIRGWNFKNKTGDVRKCQKLTQDTRVRTPTGCPRHNVSEAVCSLQTIMPEGVNSISPQEWEEIDMAVDSGATETVVSEEMIKNVETEAGPASRKGVQYEVASGELIPNLGEKNFVAVGENGVKRRMKAQVCDVNKALLSVTRMVEAGNRVVFEKTKGRAAGYVEDMQTGERMHMRPVNGMFMLKLWVKKSF